MKTKKQELLVASFEASVIQIAFLGSRPRSEHKEIIDEYDKTKKQLHEYISSVNALIMQ